MGEDFDGAKFISDILPKLIEFSEMSEYIIQKQMDERDIEEEEMSPEEADMLIEMITEALSSFFGENGTKLLRRVLRKKLREHAPDYFKSNYEP